MQNKRQKIVCMAFMLLVGTISPGSPYIIYIDGKVPNPVALTVGAWLIEYIQQQGKPVPAVSVNSATLVALGNLVLLPTTHDGRVSDQPLPLNAVLEVGKAYTCKELRTIDQAAWGECRAALLDRMGTELTKTDIKVPTALVAFENAQRVAEKECKEKYCGPLQMLRDYQETLAGAPDEKEQTLPAEIKVLLQEELAKYERLHRPSQATRSFPDPSFAIPSLDSTYAIKWCIDTAKSRFEGYIRRVLESPSPLSRAQSDYEYLARKQIELQQVILILSEDNEVQWFSIGLGRGVLLMNGELVMRVLLEKRYFYISEPNGDGYLTTGYHGQGDGLQTIDASNKQEERVIYCSLEALFGARR